MKEATNEYVNIDDIASFLSNYESFAIFIIANTLLCAGSYIKSFKFIFTFNSHNTTMNGTTDQCFFLKSINIYFKKNIF